MARFLSRQWFQQLELEPEGAVAGSEVPGNPPPFSVEIVVTEAPEGEVRYQVVVDGPHARTRWRQGDLRAPEVRFTTDYGTISAIAAGRLAAVEALAQGRARIWGNAALLDRLPAKVDLVPASVRASTTY